MALREIPVVGKILRENFVGKISGGDLVLAKKLEEDLVLAKKLEEDLAVAG